MGWGEALGSASNSFVDTYTKFQQNDRANEEQERLKAAQAIQAQLQQERLKALESQGLMKSAVQAELDKVKNKMEVIDPSTGKKTVYDNMNSYWEYNKKDPNEEIMKLILPVIAQYDPAKAAELASRLNVSRDRGDSTNRRLDEMERHNRVMEVLRGEKTRPQGGETSNNATRKEQIKTFDDAITDYNKRINYATKFLDKSVKGGKTYEAMAKSINDNQKQKDLTIERKNAFISGKGSTNPDVTTSKVPAGFTDTGKTSGGKKVYTDGKGNAWLE